VGKLISDDREASDTRSEKCVLARENQGISQRRTGQCSYTEQTRHCWKDLVMATSGLTFSFMV